LRFRIGIKHAEISDQMLFVVPRECWIGGRQIGDIGIEGQLHGHARDEGTTHETF
jgi:hypothetical protein